MYENLEEERIKSRSLGECTICGYPATVGEEMDEHFIQEHGLNEEEINAQNAHRQTTRM